MLSEMLNINPSDPVQEVSFEIPTEMTEPNLLGHLMKLKVKHPTLSLEELFIEMFSGGVAGTSGTGGTLGGNSTPSGGYSAP